MLINNFLTLLEELEKGGSTTLYSPRRKIVVKSVKIGEIWAYTVEIYNKKTNELVREYTTDKQKRIINELGKFAYISLIVES